MERRTMVGILCASACAFTFTVILSPFLYHADTIVRLDGSPGIIDNVWSVSTVQYLLGDIFCHQEMSRSFMVNGNQMPFCIRDIGIFIGVCVGSSALLSVKRTFGRRKTVFAGIALIAVTVVEWAYGSVHEDTVALRFASGMLAGVGVSMLIVCYIDSMYEKD